MSHKFKCSYCGSEELCCQKWVDHRVDVIIDHTTGHIEYGPPVINENNVFGAEMDFICKQCERPLFYRELWVHDESALREYMRSSAEDIKTANDQFIVDAEAKLSAALAENEDCEMTDC